jgi:hypothetical protein
VLTRHLEDAPNGAPASHGQHRARLVDDEPRQRRDPEGNTEHRLPPVGENRFQSAGHNWSGQDEEWRVESRIPLLPPEDPAEEQGSPEEGQGVLRPEAGMRPHPQQESHAADQKEMERIARAAFLGSQYPHSIAVLVPRRPGVLRVESDVVVRSLDRSGQGGVPCLTPAGQVQRRVPYEIGCQRTNAVTRIGKLGTLRGGAQRMMEEVKVSGEQRNIEEDYDGAENGGVPRSPSPPHGANPAHGPPNHKWGAHDVGSSLGCDSQAQGAPRKEGGAAPGQPPAGQYGPGEHRAPECGYEVVLG